MVEKKKSPNLEKLSILVVDDVKSMRLTIRKMLKNLNLGRTLNFAENGRKGMEILKSHTVDLAIIDFDMPVMDGAQMLSEIRKDKALRDMPVIMITAEAKRDLVYDVAETDIDAYILKPLTLQLLDSKIRTVVEHAANPDPATIHTQQARDLEETGDIEGAIEQVKLALGFKPSASKLIRKLGLLYQKLGEMTTAIKCLKKAVQVNPDDAVTRYLLGRIYRDRGDIQLAATYFLEVMGLTSKYNDEAIRLGKTLLEQGMNKMAIKVFSKAIATSRKSLNIKELVADICLDYEEFSYARRLLESIISEVPSRYDTVYKAGVVYHVLGEEDKALEQFLIVDSHQSTRIDVKLEIARIYLERNQVFQADDYLNRVLRKDPKNEQALAMRQSL